jgi:AraC-like DNA-binding protein
MAAHPTRHDSPPELMFAGTHKRSENVRAHAHDCPELILVLEGQCKIDIETDALYAGPGDLLVIPEHLAHNQISDGYIHTVYVGYRSPKPGVAKADVIHLDDTEMIESCMSLLAASHMHRCAVSPQSCSALLHAVLTEIDCIRESQSSHRGTTPSRLRSVLRYIDDHLSDIISIDELADHAQMSSSNLYIMFRTYMDTTPMHYVMSERMKRARRYLADPYMTVKEVAGRCGYKDTNLFVRTFKKVHGKPPGRWRDSQPAT